MNFSLHDIEQLAPDASSFSAAKGLAKPSQWQQCALHEREGGLALSGLCQGSGKNPYQTTIDLREPAFKCSCPSRKFPCKHGLALLMLYSQSASAFATSVPPDWVQAWLDKREQREEKKAEAETKPKKAKPTTVSNKRLDHAREGVAQLMMWLEDVLRQGLVGFDAEQALGMAKRMIDAQVSGLAGQIQQLAWEYLRTNNPERLHQRLSALYSLCVMFTRREALSEDWRAELDARLGFPVSKEELIAKDGVSDTWHCIGITRERLERGESVFYWLFGEKTKRFAFLMDFELAARTTAPLAFCGAVYEGELCFYSGVYPLRALIKNWTRCESKAVPSGMTLAEAWAVVQSALAQNPLLNEIPMLIHGLRFAIHHQTWYLMNETHAIPIVLSDTQKVQLLSTFTNKTLTAALLYDVMTQEYHLLNFYLED